MSHVSHFALRAAMHFASGVDDLLENTHRALRLTLKRDEASALISMFDANGDNCIQCEELEVRTACSDKSSNLFFLAPFALQPYLERPHSKGFPLLSCHQSVRPASSWTCQLCGVWPLCTRKYCAITNSGWA